MSIITKNGRPYYYRSHRVGGKVVSHYVGAGEFARACAVLDWKKRIEARMERQVAEDRRRERVEADRKAAKKARALRAKLKKTDDRIEGYSRRVDEAVAKAMTALGYHRPNRGGWRRRRGTTMGKTRPATKYDPGTLARLVREGEAKAVEYYRDNNGDADDGMRRIVVYTMPTVTGGDQPDNEDQATAIRAHMALMRDRLAPPGSSEIEILLANRAVLDWLHVARLEQQISLSHISHSYARPGVSHVDRLLTRAHARYTKSLTALAKVRRLSIPVVIAQMNVGGQHVHKVEVGVAKDGGAGGATSRPQLEKPKADRPGRSSRKRSD